MASEEEITRLNYQHPFLRPLDKRDLAALGTSGATEEHWDMSGYNIAPVGALGLLGIEPIVFTEEMSVSASWTSI
jgi:hypothetical protein